MKYRNGFVSNSSSCSFMVGSNFPLDKEEILAEYLKGTTGDVPMSFLIDAFARFIIKNIERHESVEKFDEENGYTKYGDKIPNKISYFFDKFVYVYEFSAASDDGDPISNMLYRYEDETVVASEDLEIGGMWGK